MDQAKMLSVLSGAYLPVEDMFTTESDFWVALAKGEPHEVAEAEAMLTAIESPTLEQYQAIADKCLPYDGFNWEELNGDKDQWRARFKFVFESFAMDNERLQIATNTWTKMEPSSVQTDCLRDNILDLYEDNVYAQLYWSRYDFKSFNAHRFFKDAKTFIQDEHGNKLRWWVYFADAYLQEIVLGGEQVEFHI